MVGKGREKKKKIKWGKNQEWWVLMEFVLEVGKRGAYELKKKVSVSEGEEEALTKTNAMCWAMHCGFWK